MFVVAFSIGAYYNKKKDETEFLFRPFAEGRKMHGVSYKRRWMLFLLLCGFLWVVTGCGGEETASVVQAKADFVPVFYENTYAPQALCQGIEADLSTANQGYIGIYSARSKRVKVQITKDGEKYIYTLEEAGEVAFLPLQMGSGKYQLTVYENTTENRYMELCTQELVAELVNEFVPFLHSNQYVSFTKQDESVRLAGKMAKEAESESDFVKAVYKYICSSIRYDNQLAESVQSGYLPQPDRTMELGKGICLDYSALAAAMLRSQGIPTRIIVGYMGEDALYHAWNAIYLQETGWITVGIHISAEEWARIDLTLAATGDSQKIYVDRSVY